MERSDFTHWYSPHCNQQLLSVGSTPFPPLLISSPSFLWEMPPPPNTHTSCVLMRLSGKLCQLLVQTLSVTQARSLRITQHPPTPTSHCDWSRVGGTPQGRPTWGFVFGCLPPPNHILLPCLPLYLQWMCSEERRSEMEGRRNSRHSRNSRGGRIQVNLVWAPCNKPALPPRLFCQVNHCFLAGLNTFKTVSICWTPNTVSNSKWKFNHGRQPRNGHLGAAQSCLWCPTQRVSSVLR